MISQLKDNLCLCLLASIFGLMVAMPLWAAEPQGNQANWDNLKQLGSGQEIRVVLKDAKSFQGEFQSVSDEALVIRLTTGEQTIDRQRVLRVLSKGQGHRGRNAAIGALIGGGAGAAIGAAVHSSFWTRQGKSAAVGMAIGAVMGAGVGAALPTGGWRGVYRAR